MSNDNAENEQNDGSLKGSFLPSTQGTSKEQQKYSSNNRCRPSGTHDWIGDFEGEIMNESAMSQ